MRGMPRGLPAKIALPRTFAFSTAVDDMPARIIPKRRPRGLFFRCIVILMPMCFAYSARSETDPWSGNAMLKYCKMVLEPKDDDAMAGMCAGTISTLLSIRELLRPVAAFCPPKNVTSEQATRVFVKYLETTTPERLDQDFRLLAILAFQRAWPCDPSGK
jgi:Rap1a immunity proteins